MHHDSLDLPTGKLVSAQQVLAGMALLEIQSELEIETSTYVLKLARVITKLR